ncbi:unnamed protein product [Gulo gulo]|uniref:Uncharacterized protein n=1 Tax=Gulo gulo TaxID=48420 RepID=A0A9X9Q393_GULGU|nr:unnamed protein product [Gulo gulo]
MSKSDIKQLTHAERILGESVSKLAAYQVVGESVQLYCCVGHFCPEKTTSTATAEFSFVLSKY